MKTNEEVERFFRANPQGARALAHRIAEAVGKLDPDDARTLAAYFGMPEAMRDGAESVRFLRAKIGEVAWCRIIDTLNAAVLGIDREFPTDAQTVTTDSSIRNIMDQTVKMMRLCEPSRLRHDSDDWTLIKAIDAAVARQNADDPSSPEALQRRAVLGIGQFRQLLAAELRWALNAWPYFRVGHKAAAAMMATPVDESIVDVIRLPFPSIVVEVPAGLLTVADYRRDNRPTNIAYVLVTTFDAQNPEPPHEKKKVLWRSANTGDGLTLHGSCGMRDYFLGDVTGNPNAPVAPWDHPLDDADDRTNLLLSRFIAGVCLASSNPETLVKVGKNHDGGAGKGKPHDQPSLRVFEVRAPVQVDCRQEIVEYARHGAHRPPSVMSLTRGHYRRQHFGAGRADVKVIWVHPYWRGPERGNVALRPFVVGDP